MNMELSTEAQFFVLLCVYLCIYIVLVGDALSSTTLYMNFLEKCSVCVLGVKRERDCIYHEALHNVWLCSIWYMCMSDMCCVCFCWWQWTEVDLTFVLKPKSGSCSTVRGEVLLHVASMTLCLCGFNSALQAVSGFCIQPRGSRRIFSREFILREWSKKPHLMPNDWLGVSSCCASASHRQVSVSECIAGFGYGRIQE